MNNFSIKCNEMEKRLTVREQRREIQAKMYDKYKATIKENPNTNKAELRRDLAIEFGYTSGESVNTIICRIEKKLKEIV